MHRGRAYTLQPHSAIGKATHAHNVEYRTAAVEFRPLHCAHESNPAAVSLTNNEGGGTHSCKIDTMHGNNAECKGEGGRREQVSTCAE